ncbi:hypothetical protein IFM89_028010 [Coptis chinensis]|uniref:Uncharacterized protein n=1 Tax=Coptis chinensis TaxID=261450 RepID=A0A835HN28_9MAGN|nr:hypothetical protein IFM89_028010 [Coptis chinensis]
MIKGDLDQTRAAVIDVGTNAIVDDPSRKSGYRLVGDVDFEQACKVLWMGDSVREVFIALWKRRRPALFPICGGWGGKVEVERFEDVFSECVLRLCRPPRAWGKEWIAMRVEEGER